MFKVLSNPNLPWFHGSGLSGWITQLGRQGQLRHQTGDASGAPGVIWALPLPQIPLWAMANVPGEEKRAPFLPLPDKPKSAFWWLSWWENLFRTKGNFASYWGPRSLHRELLGKDARTRVPLAKLLKYGLQFANICIALLWVFLWLCVCTSCAASRMGWNRKKSGSRKAKW